MRIRHIADTNALLRADVSVLADEYLSLRSATQHEFASEQDRRHYQALVHAWGMFAHASRFPALLRERGAASACRPAEKPVCERCGSEDLVRDAAARWDVETQSWEATSVYDSTYCDGCEAESDTLCRWVPVDLPQVAA